MSSRLVVSKSLGIVSFLFGVSFKPCTFFSRLLYNELLYVQCSANTAIINLMFFLIQVVLRSGAEIARFPRFSICKYFEECYV